MLVLSTATRDVQVEPSLSGYVEVLRTDLAAAGWAENVQHLDPCLVGMPLKRSNGSTVVSRAIGVL